jgi:hypothetical protein
LHPKSGTLKRRGERLGDWLNYGERRYGETDDRQDEIM